MKKWLAISLAFLFAFAMIIPAEAQSPTPTTTPTPTSPAIMHVVIQVGSYANHLGSGSVQCTTIEGGAYILAPSNGVFPDSAMASFDTKGFTCLGEIIWQRSYGWKSDGINIWTQWSSSGLISAEVEGNDSSTIVFYDSDFQASNATSTNDTGGPYVNGTGQSTTEIIQGGSALFEDRNTSGSVDQTADDGLDEYFYVHDTIKPPCDLNWQKTNVVSQGTIDATNEAGVTQTLVVGNEYLLTVSGGPWNDGTTDRYDTAIKTGSIDWTPLADWATDSNSGSTCTQGDPLDPTKTIVRFEASDTDWKIRVNDIAGQFGDNSGGMNYELDQVAPIVTGCQTRYLRGIAIQGGTIAATLSQGVYNHAHPADNPDVWVAGNWIEIVTSGGPWHDDSNPADRFDIALQNADNSWSELDGSALAACVTQNGNYIDSWVQLPTSNGIYLRVNDTGGNFGDNTGSVAYEIYASTYSPIPPSACAETYHLGDLIKSVTVPANLQGGVDAGVLYSGKDVTGGENDSGYFAIETSGVWYNGSIAATDAAIAEAPTTGGTDSTTYDWSNLETASGVTCAVPLDPIGHIRVYIPASEADYWFRVQDYTGNWADNSGTLVISIYKATNLQTPGYTPGTMPGAGLCDPYYSKGTGGSPQILYGNNETGITLPYLTQGAVTGKVYAIETQAGPWSNNGVDSYEVAISDDNGTTWTNLSAYASAVCAESSDGEHILLYFQALTGRNYKVRVYDPGDLFSDNTGSINFILYSNVIETNIPGQTCSDSYTLSQLAVANNVIPSNNPSGVSIPDIFVGTSETYALEISSSAYWYTSTNPDQHRFDAQISMDNGSTWSYFGPGVSMATCVMQLNDSTVEAEKIYRIYFASPSGTASPTGKVKMRIDNIAVSGSPGTVSGTVSGNLQYILYSTTAAPTPGTPCTDCHVVAPIIPPDWQAACYESYLRPSFFFEDTNLQIPTITFGTLGSIIFPSIVVPLPAIDAWISYLEFSVRSYFAWCPEHTAALAAIPTTLENYEPFGTIADTTKIFQTLETDVTSLQSSGGAGENYAPYSIAFGAVGGETNTSGFQGILPVLGADSPWLGGALKWGGGTASVEASGGESLSNLPSVPAAEGISSTQSDYIAYCVSVMGPHIGSPAATGLCGAVAMAKTAPTIWVLIQLLADVGSVWIFIQYIQRRWIDAGASG